VVFQKKGTPYVAWQT